MSQVIACWLRAATSATRRTCGAMPAKTRAETQFPHAARWVKTPQEHARKSACRRQTPASAARKLRANCATNAWNASASVLRIAAPTGLLARHATTAKTACASRAIRAANASMANACRAGHAKNAMNSAGASHATTTSGASMACACRSNTTAATTARSRRAAALAQRRAVLPRSLPPASRTRASTVQRAGRIIPPCCASRHVHGLSACQMRAGITSACPTRMALTKTIKPALKPAATRATCPVRSLAPPLPESIPSTAASGKSACPIAAQTAGRSACRFGVRLW